MSDRRGGEGLTIDISYSEGKYKVVIEGTYRQIWNEFAWRGIAGRQEEDIMWYLDEFRLSGRKAPGTSG